MDSPSEIKLFGDKNSVASLNVNVIPTDSLGIKNLSEEMEQEDAYIEPNDLLGKRLDFFIII